MTTTGSGGDRAHGLTINIYRVNPQTGTQTARRTRFLKAAAGPMDSAAFPPCRCPRCSGKDPG